MRMHRELARVRLTPVVANRRADAGAWNRSHVEAEVRAPGRAAHLTKEVLRQGSRVGTAQEKGKSPAM
jgi:hypothetical protein